MRKIRRSLGPDYLCEKDWPKDCGAQCGGSEERSFFFECTPKSPPTYIRGKGGSLREAEQDAWDQFERVLQCEEHAFERRDYRNGVGFCIHCGLMKGNAFEPLERCYLCDSPTYHGRTRDNQWYCEGCKDKVPDENLPEWVLEMRRMQKLPELTEEEFTFGLKEVINSLIGEDHQSNE